MFYNNDAPANLMFDAKVFEYNLHVYLDFTNLFAGFNPNRLLSIYGLAGVGFSNWESELKDYNTGKVLRRSGFTGSGPHGRTTELVFPVGMGLRFNLNDSWGLNLESTLHGANSDMVDASKGGFRYDVYNYSMLGLTYNFNNSRIFRGDPARREERIQRRQSRMYESEVNKYDNQVEYRRTKPSKSYDRELKKYEYEQKYDLSSKQSAEMKLSDAEKFKSEHARGDLPVVAEYEIVGIFDRDVRQGKRPIMEEPLEVEVMAMPSATTYTTSILELEEDKPRGRILTDNKIPNILRAENVYFGSEGRIIKEDQTNTNQNSVSGSKIPDMTGVTFGVQIMAKSNGGLNIHDLAARYQIDSRIYEDHSNGLYRYVAGWFNSFQTANEYARVLRNKGIYDAFVVAYRDGKRISLSSVMQ
ncbi:MAG: hypothetical protein U5Q03_06810 [Bacteroidota bacterium]|nr:hypothetical protein [Bacteroidota bacterium]